MTDASDTAWSGFAEAYHHFNLYDNAGRVIARERLIELSRARLGDSSDRSVDVLVSRLRRKLSGFGKDAPILTVRGVGYMLNVPVERG